MLKIKTLGVFAGIVTALALSAAPAVAEFQSTQKQGIGHVLVAGEFKIPSVGKTTCEAKEIEGQWHIQVKGQIKAQLTETIKGPNLEIQVKNWGKCLTETTGGSKIPTTVKPCALRATQLQATAATGGVKTSCLISLKEGTGECNIQVPAGMETKAESGQGINVGLREIKLENQAKGSLIAKVNITKGGVQQKGEGVFFGTSGKTICAVGSAGTAELVGMEIEGENLSA